MANTNHRNADISSYSAAASSQNFLKLPQSSFLDSFDQSRDEKDDFYRNLQTVREKIQRLGTARESTEEGIKRLRNATDRYTDLLHGRLRWDDLSITPSISITNTSKGDLLEDEEVQERLEAIQRKISQLENRLDQSSRNLVDKMTSAYVKDTVSSLLEANSDVSEVEKGRSMFVDSRGRSHQSKESDQIKSIGLPSAHPGQLNDSLTREIPGRDISGLGRLSDLLGDFKVDNIGRHTPRSISSAGSSLRPLNESQRSKLQQLQDGLRQELAGKNMSGSSFLQRSLQPNRPPPDRLSSFVPAPQLRFESSSDDLEECCQRCGLSKKRRCVCSAPDSSGGQLRKNESDFNLLTKRDDVVQATEAQGTQTDSFRSNMKADAACQVSNEYPSNSSPARKMPRKMTTTESSKPAPFVTGKSTGPSHSVLVNWQQLLAALKTQNPTLHDFCFRLNPTKVMSAEFLELFRREMTHLLRMWKDELRELSRDFSAAVQMKSWPGEKSRREIGTKANQIAAQMEAKDTAIQRIHRQLNAVMEAITSKRKRHMCKTATSPVQSKEHRPRHSHAKTIAKSSSVDKAILRRRQTSALMRDTKALATVISG